MQAMAANPANSQQQQHHHDSGAKSIEVSVPAGEVREWVVKFDEAVELVMACLIPGHFEAGMKGQLIVKSADAKSAEPSRTQAATPHNHDHSQHKH